MNYIQKAIEMLEKELQMRGTPYEELLELYGLLVFTQGENCTNKHIHDAWSIWQNRTDTNQSEVFQKLLKKVAKRLSMLQ